MEEESGEDRIDVFGRDRRRGDEEGDKKREFSVNGILIASAVIALIIFSAVVSAYPHGMRISESHNVIYNGNNNVFFSGAITINGNVDGIIASYDVKEGNFSGVGEIIITDGSVEKRFSNADMVIKGGDGEIKVNSHIDEKFGYAIAVFNSSNITAMGILTRDTLNFGCDGDAILHVDNSSISVKNGAWSSSGNFDILLKGGFDASISAKIFGFQTDNGINISLRRSNNADTGILDEIGIEMPPLPFDLNGAFVISGGNVSIDGSPENIKNFSFFRGEGNAFISKIAHINMRAVLIIVDGEFYTEEKGAKIWFIPDKIILFWPIAIATWIISAVIRKKYSSKMEDYDRGMSGVAMIIHILAFAISFYLWDWEIRYEFGQSIISSAMAFAGGGSAGIKELMIIPFEIVPWFAAFTLIAMPIRIILSSIFSLIGLERVGKGVGKAAGLIMLFLAGVIYIPFFLNVTLSPLIKGVMGYLVGYG